MRPAPYCVAALMCGSRMKLLQFQKLSVRLAGRRPQRPGPGAPSAGRESGIPGRAAAPHTRVASAAEKRDRATAAAHRRALPCAEKRAAMASIGTGYDQSCTTFSPDGRVFQVEYAQKAVDNSSTAVGIRCKDGVVMGVEKPKLSKMLVEGSNRRILTVDRHTGMCVSGLMADARQIVNFGRDEAANYLSQFGSQIPGEMLANRVADHIHYYTCFWYIRRCGAAVLVASYTEEGGRCSTPPSRRASRTASSPPRSARRRTRASRRSRSSTSRSSRAARVRARPSARRAAPAASRPQLTLPHPRSVIEIAKILMAQHDPAKDKPIELELSWVCDATGRRHKLVLPSSGGGRRGGRGGARGDGRRLARRT